MKLQFYFALPQLILNENNPFKIGDLNINVWNYQTTPHPQHSGLPPGYFKFLEHSLGISEYNRNNLNRNACFGNIDYENFGLGMQHIVDEIRLFTRFLWFVKDHGFRYTKIVFLGEIKGEVFDLISGIYETDAKGQMLTLQITYDELKELEKIINQYKANYGEHYNDFFRNPVQNSKFLGLTKFEKALISIQHGRSTEYIPAKIAMFIGAFECLFADDNNEISYKLSHRVALFMKNELNPQETFLTVRNGYKVRSNFLHGSSIDKNLKQTDILLNLSMSVDTLLRAVMKKILFEFHSEFNLCGDAYRNFIDRFMFN